MREVEELREKHERLLTEKVSVKEDIKSYQEQVCLINGIPSNYNFHHLTCLFYRIIFFKNHMLSFVHSLFYLEKKNV